MLHLNFRPLRCINQSILRTLRIHVCCSLIRMIQIRSITSQSTIVLHLLLNTFSIQNLRLKSVTISHLLLLNLPLRRNCTRIIEIRIRPNIEVFLVGRVKLSLNFTRLVSRRISNRCSRLFFLPENIEFGF